VSNWFDASSTKKQHIHGSNIYTVVHKNVTFLYDSNVC